MIRRLRLAICACLAWLYERISPPPLPVELAADVARLNDLRTAAAVSNVDALRGVWQASEALACDASLPTNERTAWKRQAEADKRAYLAAVGSAA